MNNSTSRTNTFNLEQIPFCCSSSVCLPLCLSVLCTFSAASCICHCHGEQPKHVAALNFAQFLSHVLLFFVSFFFFLFASHTLPSIVLRSPTQSTPAARCSVRLHKLTHKKEQQKQQHYHHQRERERALCVYNSSKKSRESRRQKESKSKERLNKEGAVDGVVVVAAAATSFFFFFRRCWLFSSKIFLFVCSSFDSYVNFHIC